MYHSIIFQKCNSDGTVASTKNTWGDWHLVPSSRPVFSPPAQKTYYVDIPGADGSLDLSDSLTGYPVFENRKGSFEFLVINESDGLSSPGTDYGAWFERYTEIMEFLHGRELRAILEDDPDFFYEGRFSVNAWASEEERSKIAIDYNVKPYKRSTTLTSISDSIASTNEWVAFTINQSDLGSSPTCPEIKISNVDPLASILAKYDDDEIEHSLKNGTHKLPDFTLYGKSQYTLYFKGIGDVSIEFREGRM